MVRVWLKLGPTLLSTLLCCCQGAPLCVRLLLKVKPSKQPGTGCGNALHNSLLQQAVKGCSSPQHVVLGPERVVLYAEAQQVHYKADRAGRHVAHAAAAAAAATAAAILA